MNKNIKKDYRNFFLHLKIDTWMFKEEEMHEN